jgi:carbon starvation protein
VYGFAASVLPVWLLLAPRDYLSTFMKLGTVAVLGVFIVVVAPPLKMPAVTQFVDGSGWVVPGPVFPFVCITIACGAISGFHSLISSGTTPKLLMREKHIRLVGYGSMVTEMLVALSAIIAACALEPGQYFAINTPADPPTVAVHEAVIARVNAAGFAVTLPEMQQLAAEMQEPTLIGKTGGAPTFAVGMAMMFHKVFGGLNMLGLWYHFAIMFEALFILTTLDAGTRVGRFILQDLLGQFVPSLGDTRSMAGNVVASALLVAAWGYFLYQGIIDPSGIATALWPIFGIANQLLAVIAFCLGTTILVKMGRARYAWTTGVPLVFLLVVTFTAGTMKIFSAKAAGFLPAIAGVEAKLAVATDPVVAAKLRATLINLRVDVGITVFFLVMVGVIVSGCAVEWVKILTGRKRAELREAPYATLPESS